MSGLCKLFRSLELFILITEVVILKADFFTVECSIGGLYVGMNIRSRDGGEASHICFVCQWSVDLGCCSFCFFCSFPFCWLDC